jgi:UDP-N-acetylbacillosamine transaminase
VQNKRIFLSPPHMGGNELRYIEEVFKSNYIAPVGEYIEKFEQIVSQFTGIKYAAAVSSGTAAIHLALKVLNISNSDIVLCSTFTFIGSASPIIFQGATPFFIDSNLSSWNLDPSLLEEAINFLERNNKKPKALIVTHLYGQPANIEKISEICNANNIFLIEDAAESLGAKYNNKFTGGFGDIGIFSFNGNKIITTSGGGMLVSNNEHYIEKAKFYATQAKEDYLWYEHKEIGYNYRMSNVLAAIGVGQMEILEHRINKKREIFKYYQEQLQNIEEIIFMPELKNAYGNRWLTCLIMKKTSPITIIRKLNKHNIEARPLWKPMHLQPVFKNCSKLINGTSEKLFKQGICLPSGTDLTEKDIKYISKIIKEEMI